jgi:tetratricopeptide (TPR) repeat protein
VTWSDLEGRHYIGTPRSGKIAAMPARSSTLPSPTPGMRLLVMLALALLAPIATTPIAHAQAKPDFEAARKHYLDAREAMARGDREAAIKEYIAAYEITKDPTLFRQIAQAYEAEGRRTEAAVYYRRYLAEAKTPPDAEDIRARIARLDKEASAASPPPTGAPPATPSAAETPAPAGAPPPVPAPETTPPSFQDETGGWQRTTAWISVGLAAVLLTTGSVLGTAALSRQDDIQRLVDFRDPTTGLPKPFTGTVAQDYKDRADEGNKLDTYAKAAFIGAGVAAAAATLFFILDATSGRKAPPERGSARVAPVIGKGTAGLVAGWEF